MSLPSHGPGLGRTVGRRFEFKLVRFWPMMMAVVVVMVHAVSVVFAPFDSFSPFFSHMIHGRSVAYNLGVPLLLRVRSSSTSSS